MLTITLNRSQILSALLAASLLLVLVPLLAYVLPVGRDWLVIRQGTLLFLQGQDPYAMGAAFRKVYEPPWTYLLLAPFAVLPYAIGRALLFLASLIAFFITAFRLGASRFQLVLFVLSSAVAGCLNNGNLDALVTLGFWMPPAFGLFFVLIKPQVGVGIAVYWLVETWRAGGWRQALRTFGPVTAAYFLSFLLYGFWPRQLLGMQTNYENMSAFPWILPLGIFLLARAVRDRDDRLSMVVGPFFAPYASQFSYAGTLLGLLSRPKLFVAAWILLWIPVLIRVFAPLPPLPP